MVYRWTSCMPQGLLTHVGYRMQPPESDPENLQRTWWTHPTRWEWEHNNNLTCLNLDFYLIYVWAGTHARPALATSSVNIFMQKMYYSISESCPLGALAIDRQYFDAAFLWPAWPWAVLIFQIPKMACQLAGSHLNLFASKLANRTQRSNQIAN